MRLQPIIAQLETVAALRLIGGALEFAGLKNVPGKLPAGFIVPENLAASISARVGVIDQKVSEDFAVVLILAPARAGDDAVSDDLHALQTAVISVLVGWLHPDASAATQLLGARLIAADATAFTWAIRFRTWFHVRS